MTTCCIILLIVLPQASHIQLQYTATNLLLRNYIREVLHWDIWGSHVGEDDDVVILGRDAV
jgi:hypothetical protein